jgi:hypothetical protein
MNVKEKRNEIIFVIKKKSTKWNHFIAEVHCLRKMMNYFVKDMVTKFVCLEYIRCHVLLLSYGELN